VRKPKRKPQRKPKTSTCVFCSKDTPLGHNYCNCDCHVADAKRMGGKVTCPNGLPIACIKANGDMLEHEHGDHPDYKFPVTIKYSGSDFETPESQLLVYGKLLSGDELQHSRDQVHALIYTDGGIAVTLYECCYATWYVRDGRNFGGTLWSMEPELWRLSPASLDKIRGMYNARRGR